MKIKLSELRQIIRSVISETLHEASKKKVEIEEPEYASVEAYAEFLLDDEREDFTFDEVTELNQRLGLRRQDIVKELEGYGLKYTPRETEKRVRGFKTSSNDRWFGPGSSDSHGGSGADQICGFATTTRTLPFGTQYDPDKSAKDKVGRPVSKK